MGGDRKKFKFLLHRLEKLFKNDTDDIVINRDPEPEEQKQIPSEEEKESTPITTENALDKGNALNDPELLAPSQSDMKQDQAKEDNSQDKIEEIKIKESPFSVHESDQMSQNSAPLPEIVILDNDEKSFNTQVATGPPKLMPPIPVLSSPKLEEDRFIFHQTTSEEISPMKIFKDFSPQDILKEHKKRYLFRQRVYREMEKRVELYSTQKCVIVCAK